MKGRFRLSAEMQEAKKRITEVVDSEDEGAKGALGRNRRR